VTSSGGAGTSPPRHSPTAGCSSTTSSAEMGGRA
jgi:hypothetical protein